MDHAAPPPPTLSVADARAEEGGTLVFTVRLSEASDAAVTVDYATSDGTATAGQDYTAASGTLTFAAGVLEQTVEVTAVTDRTDEGDETFTVSLSNPSGATLADGEATGTVENVAPVTAPEPVPGRPTGLQVAAQPGSLDVSADWDDVASATSYLVRWRVAGAGNELNEGVEVESSETTITVAGYGQWVVRVEACNDAGCGLGVAQRFTVEDVAPPPTLSVADARAGEGGTLRFAVRLSEASDAAVTVDYATADGTATAGEDYTAGSGTLTFNAGELEQTIQVAALADRTEEGDETFTVSLSNPSGATLADREATGTVGNVAAPLPTLNVADARAEEGGTLRFAVRLGEAGDSAVTVDYATSDATATAGDDYTAASGTLTFAAGVLEQTVEVAALADRADEGDETFTMSLSNPSGATLADGEATGTVENVAPVTAPEPVPGRPTGLQVAAQPGSLDVSADWDDVASATSYLVRWRVAGAGNELNEGVEVESSETTITVAGYGQWVVRVEACNDAGCGLGVAQRFTVEDVAPPPTLSVADARAGEGGTLRFAVRLSEASDAAVTVDYATADGTATAGEDYTAGSGTLTFNAGELEQTIQVAALADRTEEGDETFTVSLSNPSGATLADREATGTVGNVAAPLPTLNVADARAEEGGTLRFAVRLGEAGDSAVTVDYATSDATATAGDDYTAASGTLTFAAGVLEQTVEVAALADRTEEGDETFTVSLSNPSGATLADREATGTVENVAPEPEGNAPPVFNPDSYSFSIAESAEVWNPVGSVAATDPDAGDTVTYHITAGNGAGRFIIDLYFGEILVWGALDHETVPTYTLTVEARDGNGGTATATVEINVTDVAE